MPGIDIGSVPRPLFVSGPFPLVSSHRARVLRRPVFHVAPSPRSYGYTCGESIVAESLTCRAMMMIHRHPARMPIRFGHPTGVSGPKTPLLFAASDAIEMNETRNPN